MKSSDRKYSDFAILYRTNSQSRTFEEALSRRDIPYRVLGGLSYYDRKEIKDILCYMRLVVNRADDLALIRVINEPKRGVGGKTMKSWRALAAVRGESLFDTLKDEEVISSLSSKAAANIREFVEMIEAYGSEAADMKISDLYDGILVKSGYLRSLEALEEKDKFESESRIENLMEFKSVIYDYEEEDSNITLSEFMERIALLADVDNPRCRRGRRRADDDAQCEGPGVPVRFHAGHGGRPVPGMEGIRQGGRPLKRSADCAMSG